MADPYLQVLKLKKAYAQPDRPVPVLSDVSFAMSEGESLSIVGQSGVGKSTLLHCVGLLDSFEEGEIRFGGDIVARGGLHALRDQAALERRKKIGFVFQFHYLMGELTAHENVMVPLLLEKRGMDEAASRSREMLSNVGLAGRLDHRPSQLSGGEQQRVAIARALVSQPKIILADEPTGNLDPKTADHVFSVLKDQCLRLKAILIMATHNLELARNLDKTTTLSEGRLQ